MYRRLNGDEILGRNEQALGIASSSPLKIPHTSPGLIKNKTRSEQYLHNTKSTITLANSNLHIPPFSFSPSVNFCPRLEAKPSKLASELGHLVQWDGTTINQSNKTPHSYVLSIYPIPCVRAPVEAPIERLCGPSGFFPNMI